MKDLLLITSPFTQLNTPYPATAYLKGFLNTKGISAFQADLGIEVILALFSKQNLSKVFKIAEDHQNIKSDNAKHIFALKEHYIHTIDEVVSFLQGKQSSLARLICSDNFLPQGSRFKQAEEFEYAFGAMGFQDQAKHMSTLYLEDLADFIVACVDANFGFSRYAEKIGLSAHSFDPIYSKLQEELSFIDQLCIERLEEIIQEQQPKLICFSVPFPGNLFSTFRCAQHIKNRHPQMRIAMGGGFPNTELREIKDIRVFEFFDYITLDDGELPIELLASNVINQDQKNPDHLLFKRTLLCQDNAVVYNDFSLRKDYAQKDLGTPDYSDLLLDQYISTIEIANPMHSLWLDGRWNKLTMAHGCYWGKCTFCDVSLDYIKNYEPLTAKLIVDRIETLIQSTGERGFHFVDEAAPPALMKEIALEILDRKLVISWWANIRFEKTFTLDLCKLLKASGCIAISGGLEVASDRLLQLIKKGVSVEQVAQVCHHFTNAGIMVHSYLMYGYPTQTVQETIDSLEMVRQMFELGILQSGFWHQFALTAHSPIGKDPEKYGIIPNDKPSDFAKNDIQFRDKTGIKHEKFSYGLRKSLLNYMYGQCFDHSLQKWFNFKTPKTTIDKEFISKSIRPDWSVMTKPGSKLCWLLEIPDVSYHKQEKKTGLVSMLKMHMHTHDKLVEVSFEKERGEWLLKLLSELKQHKSAVYTIEKVQEDYLSNFEDFHYFWYSKPMDKIKKHGLLAI